MKRVTVGTQMQSTIANCESALANLKTFALETQDQNMKQIYQQLAEQQKAIVEQLNARLEYIQQEEPQYKEM